ncbi:MAG: hypothetical protein KAI28_06255, partial [Sphingomonadales bacterium]|nr:hypothetical protein [Sphingomonadales bacterium]
MPVWHPMTIPTATDTARGQEILAIVEASKPIPLEGAAIDLLLGVAGASPFLSQVMERHPAFTARCLADGPTQHVDDVMEALSNNALECRSADGLMKVLRQAREKIALLCALAEISGDWDIPTSTLHLTRFADRALQLATARAIEDRIRRGDLPWPTGDEAP